MKEYLVEAIRQENHTVVDSWDLFTCSEKIEAIEEAKTLADGDSSINARLMGYTHILVHEVELDDEYGSPCGCEEIASFKVK